MRNGEKNSHTAVHAVRKGRPKWIPDAWGYTGPSCPRGYTHKYGGVALQVGDRAIGLQPVAVEEAVKKPNLWPRKSQTEWNRPRQWERINKMRIATWNVCKLYKAGAMNE